MHVLAPPFQLHGLTVPSFRSILWCSHVASSVPSWLLHWDVTARAPYCPMLAHIGVAGGGGAGAAAPPGGQLNAAIAGQQPAPVAHSHGVARSASVALPRSYAPTQAASSPTSMHDGTSARAAIASSHQSGS